MRKCYNETEAHIRCSDSLNVKPHILLCTAVPMITGKLPPQLKLIASRNLRSELWGLAELLSLINTEIKEQSMANKVIRFDHLV